MHGRRHAPWHDRPMRRLRLPCLLLALLPLPVDAADAILVFSRTEGFRHASIPAAVAALRDLAAEQGWQVTHSEDPAQFTPSRLAGFRAVVFASTTGNVLDAAQQAALQAYIEGGGGFMGVHAAADTEYDWPWYGELVGARFANHPSGLQRTRVQQVDGHSWPVTDELYNFRRNPRPWVRVLATVDEGRYSGGAMGEDHPITWCRPQGKGRSWYTGLGHDAAVYADRNMRAMLKRGLAYAGGASAECWQPPVEPGPRPASVAWAGQARHAVRVGLAAPETSHAESQAR